MKENGSVAQERKVETKPRARAGEMKRDGSVAKERKVALGTKRAR